MAGRQVGSIGAVRRCQEEEKCCIGLDCRKFAEIVGNYIEWTPGLQYANYCMMATRWNTLLDAQLKANRSSKVSRYSRSD